MNRISGMPDDLLVKILLFVPTKVAVTTSILSKKWKFLWMLLPKLEYNSRYYSESECKRLQSFLDRNLPLHRAPVIESFCLKFCKSQFKPEDIELWVLAAVSRNVRELEISQFCSFSVWNNILPSSLYTYKTLVTLKLYGKILVYVPRMVCLPSLKTLRLQEVTYYNDDPLQRLLSNCPVLEDLLVEGCVDDNLRKFIVIVPSLKRLKFHRVYDLDEIVIKTPSLKYLRLRYYSSKSHHCLIENMPKLREAAVDVSFPILERLIGSITSVKRLTLWQINKSSEGVYGHGFVFNQLVHLDLCICQRYAPNVLVRLLKDSPYLRVLHIVGWEVYETNNERGV